MQYSLDELRIFLAEPTQHKQKYTDALLDDLINELFPNNRDDVASYLDLLPDHAKSLRVKLACVHLSFDQATANGSIDKLLQNIDRASQDYRDLLMAYYV